MAQSRGKLVEEFEKWYRVAFIGDMEEEKSKLEVGRRKYGLEDFL